MPTEHTYRDNSWNTLTLVLGKSESKRCCMLTPLALVKEWDAKLQMLCVCVCILCMLIININHFIFKGKMQSGFGYRCGPTSSGAQTKHWNKEHVHKTENEWMNEWIKTNKLRVPLCPSSPKHTQHVQHFLYTLLVKGKRHYANKLFNYSWWQV